LPTGLEHLPQHVVLSFLAFALDLLGCQVAVKVWLTDQFKRHRQRHIARMVKAVEEVDANAIKLTTNSLNMI
jgi:uncharacterized protein YbjQ (UPF0145 family)